MLDGVISKISDDFLKEAKQSPNLLHDMASMEKYMAESYSGRIFIELLQNADDAYATKIGVYTVGNHIVFANNGREFNKEDILAISRSGASTKKRSKNIGYRGIGFKSTTYVTDEIYIYSASTYFSYSKKVTANMLGANVNEVPLVRIPFLVTDIDREIIEYVNKLVCDGYTTVFVLCNAKTDIFIQEIKEITNGYFLFLNNVESCMLKIKDYNNTFDLTREEYGDDKIISFKSKDKERWLVVGDALTKIAFYYADGKIKSCNDKEAIYHSYLPTTDKVAYKFKINSDFTTDPSRKHITMDERSLASVNNVGAIIFNLIKKCIYSDAKDSLSNLITILNDRSSFSLINTKLHEVIKNNITCTQWLDIGDEVIDVSKYKIMPNWLEASEKQALREYSRYVKNITLSNLVYSRIEGLESFISQYSNECYTTNDLISILREFALVDRLNIITYSKILAKLINSLYSDMFTSKIKYDYSEIIIKTICRFEPLKNIDNVKIDAEVQGLLLDEMSLKVIEWFANKNKLRLHKDKRKETQKLGITDLIKENKKTFRNHVSKWRSAEQQCIELEESKGYTAIDVSKRNVGYDIESTDKTGKKRYIEVKSLSNFGSAFSITNNEYTAAHQFGEQYYICLMIQDDVELKVLYIKNPLKRLDFEKRIRQWEWYCDDYSGELLKVKY